MKKNIIFILISVVFLALSCQKDSNIEIYDLGSEFLISSAGMTSLDDHAVVVIDNVSKNLTSISVTHNGVVDADGEDVTPATTDIGTISISAGEGNISLTDAQLGISAIGWKANLVLESEFSGKPIKRTYSLTVKDPISVEDPGILHKDTLYHFQFSIKPKTATVTSVDVETKLFYDGTYATEAGTFEAIDSLGLNGSDYNIGDTIYVRVTGHAGTKSQSKVTKLVVAPDSYKNVNTFKLLDASYDGLSFDLIEGVHVTNATDSADILTIAYGPGIDPEASVYGLITSHNLLFMVGTATDYSNADMIDISTADFSGATTSTDNLKVGDIYLYRTYRDAAPGTYYYGIIKIASINVPDGVLENTEIFIEYKN